MANTSVSEYGLGLQADDFLGSLVRAARQRPAIVVAVCWPCHGISLMGATDGAAHGLIRPILVGHRDEILAVAKAHELNLDSFEIVDENTEADAAAKCVELCQSGNAAAIMKGSLHTDVLMHAVLKAGGLRTSRRMSHVFVVQAPLYHGRALLITDAVVNIYPSLEDKVDIVQNAVDLAHTLGIPAPKVAILSAIETVNPKITSTVDAAALCKMADRGQITGAILDGPLAFDTAVSTEAASEKDLRSLVAGDADILVVPDLDAGNMLAKELEYLGGAHLAGIVMGATVPIILTSRADSVEARIASCAIASLIVAERVS